MWSFQHSSAVSVDPDNILREGFSARFIELNDKCDEVFNSCVSKYNGFSGPLQAVVNMGPTLLLQRKGRLPHYNKEMLLELQTKFDELEKMGVFATPEQMNVIAKYLNLSFLIRKPAGGYRLVTSFGEVAQYSKPQPSLKSTVDNVLRDKVVYPQDVKILVGNILNVNCTVHHYQLASTNSTHCMFFVKRFHHWENCTLIPREVLEDPACHLASPPPAPSSTSTFQKCAISSLHVTTINSTTISLHYPVKVPELDEAQYHCYVVNRGQIKKASIFVRMYSVSNVSCVVEDFTSMMCSWEWRPSPTALPGLQLNTSVVWSSGDGNVDEACPVQTMYECRWPSSNFSMGSVYVMMVSVLTLDRWGNVTKTEQTQQISFDTNTIVSLSPIRDLHTESINSSCAQLTWQTLYNADSNTTCRVQYNCTELLHNCQCDETDEPGTATICGLSPLTQYEWRVSCRAIMSQMWSRPVAILHTTPSDSPNAGPLVHSGSYMELACSQPNCRLVQVYWKNLASHLSNGDIKTYKLLATDLATGHWETVQRNFSNETSATLTVRKDRNYSIRINFCTSSSCQDFSNPIVVPSRGNGVPSPEGFTVELVSEEEPAYLNLTWRPLDAAVPLLSYTVFWCKGTTNNCRSPLNWYGVSGETNQHKLALPGLTRDTFREYQVGVSAEAELKWREGRARRSLGVVASSGITWSPCLYGQPTVPSFVIENVHQSQSLTSDSVDVTWDPPTCQQTTSSPTGVLLIYCVASGNSCTGPELNKTVVGMSSGSMLSGLQPGQTYLLTVQAMTRAGPGPPSQPVTLAVKQDLTLLIAVLLSFGILLLLLLIIFFIVWGIRRMCTSGSEEISVPGEEKLLPEKQGVPPPPPLNPPPEGRASYRNNSYRQRQDEEKRADSMQLLKPDFYKEAPSQRSSAPVKVDNCYMVLPSTKSNTRHSKRHSDNNNKPPIVTGLEAKSDDSFPLLDFTDEGIPRERLSSFKGHLIAKDYGFAVKGQIDYEDLLNAQLEREKAESQESVSKKNSSEKKPNDIFLESQKSHKKTQSVSFSDDEKLGHKSAGNSHSPSKSVAVHSQSNPRIAPNKERPPKKERRWSRGRPESDGHQYSDVGHRRLSKDSDFPTPPPTPPLYVKKESHPENRFSGQDFPAPPPPPPTYHERQQTPESRHSGQFSFPTPPPPPLEPEDGFGKFDSLYPIEGHEQLPSTIQNLESVRNFPPSPNEMYGGQPQMAVLSPKQRMENKQEIHQRFPPAPNEMNSQFNYPLQHGFIPAPKERKIELHQESQPMLSTSPKEDKKIPSPKQRTKGTRSPQPFNPVIATVVEPRSPISPDRLSKTLSQADPDSTLDISFLLGDVLGGGMTVRTTENNTNEVQMRPKPRQNIPIEPNKHQPSISEAVRMDSLAKDHERAEIVMGPNPLTAISTPERDSKTISDPTERVSKGKFNPPEVAPKPVFIKAKDSVYGRLESSLAQQESVPRSPTSQNPDYVRYT